MSATVLLSGGIDSSVLLHYVYHRCNCKKIHALFYRYGQKHSVEENMARKQAQSLGNAVKFSEVDLSFFGSLLQNATALTEGGQSVPDLADIPRQQLEQPSTYVPCRNLLFLAIAAAVAEAEGRGVVFYGAQHHDEYSYWDCSPEFVERLNSVLALNRYNSVSVKAPLVNMSKTECVQLGLDLGVPLANTWSCYRGGPQPCGTCPTCVERRNAFEYLGISDPLENL